MTETRTDHVSPEDRNTSIFQASVFMSLYTKADGAHCTVLRVSSVTRIYIKIYVNNV
jgi:hypothetical protein